VRESPRGEQPLGEARNRVLVDALAQTFAQFDCEATRLLKNFFDRAASTQRGSGKKQPKITGFSCLDKVEIDLDVGFGSGALAHVPPQLSEIKPELSAVANDSVPKLFLVGDLERPGDRGVIGKTPARTFR
jgi:hypothetical protein